MLGKWAEEVKADPSLAAQQPYKAIIEKDPAFFVGLATQHPEAVYRLGNNGLQAAEGAAGQIAST